MTAHHRPSLQLALYGLAFRTLRALAVHAADQRAPGSTPAVAGAPAKAGPPHGLGQIAPVRTGAEPLPGAAPGQEG
jgi:hypothetical protein